MEKRVVITGRGAVTPVGNTLAESWENIKAGKHGFAEITHFDIEPHKVKMGAEVKNFDFGDKRAAKRLESFFPVCLNCRGRSGYGFRYCQR